MSDNQNQEYEIDYIQIKSDKLTQEKFKRYVDLFYKYLNQFISKEALEEDVRYCFENGRVMGAYLDDNLIGAVAGTHTPFFDKFHIAHLAVEEEHQSQGIGSKLVKKVIPKDTGASVHLNIDNPKIERFYNKLGFKKTHNRFKKTLKKDTKPSD